MEELLLLRRDHSGEWNKGAVDVRRMHLSQLKYDEVQFMELVGIPEALRGRGSIVRENAMPLLGRLDMITEVRFVTSPSQLLEFAEQRGGTLADRRRRLEALMTFDYALAIVKMETEERFHALKDDTSLFASLLQEKLFSSRAEEVRFWSEHDPRKHFEATDVRFHRPNRVAARNRHAWAVFCRFAKIEKREMAIAFDYRIKSRFDTWLKMQKQHSDPDRRSYAFEVRDKCGLRMTVVSNGS
ncbi:MAG: hypothetical protein UY77_C0028G0017 [Candidatus Uhrbacteria bacterium GW2011_GWA2_53_10]|uniref:Uncharacterized protein n=1 Tax=Candidatus Uhrbacteria bacterium GW2011_GWA2_53_10 TaxID=1618980 RepID=A0A0G2AIB5_9BACT|nr:MAG: hypothetical protein UY77_C0028G0017 [Candidatus Uhrbacteria bacterium GW2011_GWA2_53_10]